jgi:hypothetical protein
VPGCKTDVVNAQWLTILARAGLLRPSFIPPAEIWYLRSIIHELLWFLQGDTHIRYLKENGGRAENKLNDKSAEWFSGGNAALFVKRTVGNL